MASIDVHVTTEVNELLLTSPLSDETLTKLFEAAPIDHNFGGTKIVRLSQTLILKGGPNTQPGEANILNFIAKAGEENGARRIRASRVHRLFNIERVETWGEWKCLILMDFINGTTLDRCWDELSQKKRVDVVDQVALMLDTLHSIPLPDAYQQLPGPKGDIRCLAHGYMFLDEGAGPFASIQEMEAWFDRRLDVGRLFNRIPEDVPSFHFDKLVLTHQDVMPRNLILDGEGMVWLIDWGYSGIYPEGFDYVGIKKKRSFGPEFVGMLLERITSYEELFQHMRHIVFGLTTGRYL
ncbi:hypothetical protein BO94DRAFT_628598 [Aspergillus sclerotioniger CBS 115572]|uniref:Protein kinase domain-containing protein n=1 Tax=Aspergillus sclerotioniger CBS 115572 TaxID=1450535 RepID=A0A317V4H9_9EURO|nr:hypothetical protein BO94DRAFT_628598 [Aspergillus sclerotioniger CBS 115572]PWY69005.1 hypothetical protein BO94DRAFT_628598 [Aspergillus sclerotioniger CBS 115572]